MSGCGNEKCHSISIHHQSNLRFYSRSRTQPLEFTFQGGVRGPTRLQAAAGGGDKTQSRTLRKNKNKTNYGKHGGENKEDKTHSG